MLNATTGTVYCTVLSAQRIAQALALQQSIAAHTPSTTFAFFCIDRATATTLKRLDLRKVKIFEPEEFIGPELQARRPTLKVVEFCAICKSVALKHAFTTMPAVQWVVWLDSDMFAFGDVDTALSEAVNADVVLTPHRFTLPEFQRYEPIVGRFNAGYVAFKGTSNGRAALQWWADRCLEGCPIEPTEHLFADQKYLNSIPSICPVAEASIGVNCAPWNVFGMTIEKNGVTTSVSGVPLRLYHFQGLRVIRPWLFDLYASRLRLPKNVRKLIYGPYVAALADQLARTTKCAGHCGSGTSTGNMLRTALNLVRARNLAFHFAGRPAE